ncbi:branched-chain amino acid aminotransferase II [Dacryopinax primogenitus]|uniref:Branched-chain-amino-acid aminotransferase n=1 Tax=Dacryopinax primogenitus (strain DJM 731) TaxID=1858805 RepID=M5FQC6_DACPD|nr:branched-chain amino acid aminotransferase II [Dacryopinax primogenitus]EJT99075.1 branched-chain amino acid aminotransferase II [Dacryopinax primogenitus]
MAPVAIETPVHTNGTNGASSDSVKKVQQETEHVHDIDPSKLTLHLKSELTPVPAPETLTFGTVHTDHMLVLNYSPELGWSAPSIEPYGPMQVDPMASCIQYATNIFEGMKAYMGADGRPRLFRPDLNMARMKRSADRLALPPFDEQALLKLIKTLVMVEKRWIPTAPGCSLYIRPTMFGTRCGFGVTPSTSATLLVILSPSGPYFPGPVRPISLYAESRVRRAWPGGTGGHKLALNYAPTLRPTHDASLQGYNQILWLFGDDDHLGEVGQMNAFVVLRREDGSLDVITPPLDGTILPGVTRQSVLDLTRAHMLNAPIPGLPAELTLHVQERHMPIAELVEHSEAGRLAEVFGVGTAAVLVPINRIGYGEEGKEIAEETGASGFGPVAKAVREEIMAIQEARRTHVWSVPCDE